MTDRPRLLIWTENYWIGGCDRFLVDLMLGLRDAPVQIGLAGNPHPEFDEWLARRIPWALPRTVVPVANLVRTPLHHLDRWRSRGRARAPTSHEHAGSQAPATEPLPWRAAIASGRYGQAMLNLERLRRLLRQAQPDVLLINNGGYPGGESCRVASVAARQVGVPRVIHFVHNMAYPPAWPVAVERVFDQWVDHGTDRWATAAYRASDELSRQRHIHRDRIATVHYGIDVPEGLPTARPGLRATLGFAPDRPGLIAVANLEPRKGIDVLVRALASLRDDGVELPAVIVGDGPMRAPIEHDVRRLGLERTVRLLGWRDDVYALMAHADLLALPSLANECLPYVILEAMAHRLPVVSTDVAGIPEMVIDGETGRIVAPGDAMALAAALRSMIADPARMRTMGERGYARLSERFGPQAMIRAMGELLGIA